MSTPSQPPKDLLDAAQAARQRAYVPYSHFAVGAALRLADGTIVAGANVENASYGLSCCAERTAAFTAASQGAREFEEALVVADTAGPASPCGACRQVLSEFMSPQAPVWLVARDASAVRTTIGELLPGAFGPGDLEGVR